ncbi:MAG TPA: hypothetical protein VMX13_06970, partial [Sedimentisphaerales bacterium]|nr:hypothetical protein [Sedimentisphaerales bacterium]
MQNKMVLKNLTPLRPKNLSTNPHISQGNQNQRRRVILAESWFSRLVLTHSAHNSPLPPYSNRDFR